MRRRPVRLIHPLLARLALLLLAMLCTPRIDAASLTASATTSAFPRLASIWLARQDYQRPDIQAQLARNDVAVINTWVGWEDGRGASLEQVVRAMKARNPRLLVFNYINHNEISKLPPSPDTEPYRKLQSMGWFLYAKGGDGDIVPSVWGAGNFHENNITLFTPPDEHGDRWTDWYAKWSAEHIARRAPSLDGLMTDNLFVKPRVTGDWNRDGVADSPDDPRVQAWYRAGNRRHIEVLRRELPGKLQIANVGFDPSAPAPEYEGLLDGSYLEGMLGYEWSREKWGGWQAMMTEYRGTLAHVLPPKLVLFMQVGNPADYRTFRYGFASCLLDDGYFAFNSSEAYDDDPWFDEYSVRLGAAVTGPPSIAWQSGVYRRDFSNGIVLVNPKGNGARQVFLDQAYVKLRGTQDKAVNDGSTVRSVTLQERDGIVLLRPEARGAQRPFGER